MKHFEHHSTVNLGWLRAGVLGANDGIVSTASLILGVAASGASQPAIFMAGLAGLVAGAMSMAAGEYVSVSSQDDSMKADLDKERRELRDSPEHELAELTQIYVERGLSVELAAQVASELMEHDALAAHARDELGITDFAQASPWQAAAASASMFSLGAFLPLLLVWFAPEPLVIWIGLSSLVFLGLLGWLSAALGKAPVIRAVLRVVLWGAFAMLATSLVGRIFGVVA